MSTTAFLRRAVALLAALAVASATPLGAQEGGDSGSFEVTGVDVDTTGPNAEVARLAGWRLAQRKGFAMLARRLGAGGGRLSDGALDAIVSGIVVEREEIGPTRYVARLGVRFDRARAASILGVSGALTRSPPMLLVPVLWTGGAPLAFERKNPWLDAWARYNSGNSTIDYVRPAGTGPDSLLINAGQINRPGRGQWRATLAQYGASDVVIPIVHLQRLWPDGPIIGHFQARFGPDNRLLTGFSLRVNDSDALPNLLDAGVQRIDAAYQQALSAGILRVDPGLNARVPVSEAEATTAEDSFADEAVVSDTGAATSITVQVDTPSAGSVDAAQASLRGIGGVRGVGLTSLALGGISVLRVDFAGDAAALAAALEARGWQVTQGAGALRIQRRTANSPPPEPQPDNASAG